MIQYEHIRGNKKYLLRKINYTYKMGTVKQINIKNGTYYF